MLTPRIYTTSRDAPPRRGLARKADGTPTNKTQRNHRSAEDCVYTDSDSHLMQSGGSYLQGYNCQLVVDRDHQVIAIDSGLGVVPLDPTVRSLENVAVRV